MEKGKLNCEAATFGLELFQRLQKAKRENLVISPLSLHLALGFAYMGSAGETQEQMSKVLRIPSDKEAALHFFHYVICKYKHEANRKKVRIANKIYLQKGYKITSMIQKAAKKFQSELENVNFADIRKTIANINGWVADNTNGKIKDILSEGDIDPRTVMVIVNAIYFKCSWRYEMQNAGNMEFWLNENDKVQVQFIASEGELLLKDDKDLDCKAVELPFDDNDLLMILILPNKRSGLDDLMAKIARGDFERFRQGFRLSKVQALLPKFRIESGSIEMKEHLEEMGMRTAFDSNRANFSELIENKKVWIETVIHKTYIDVNEKGVEAAAATGAAVLSDAPYDPIYFYANHPFLFALISRRNRMFFWGACRNPSTTSARHTSITNTVEIPYFDHAGFVRKYDQLNLTMGFNQICAGGVLKRYLLRQMYRLYTHLMNDAESILLAAAKVN